jgi:hypothetical protein
VDKKAPDEVVLDIDRTADALAFVTWVLVGCTYYEVDIMSFGHRCLPEDLPCNCFLALPVDTKNFASNAIAVVVHYMVRCSSMKSPNIRVAFGANFRDHDLHDPLAMMTRPLHYVFREFLLIYEIF